MEHGVSWAVQYAIKQQLLITRVCCEAVRPAILAAAWLLVDICKASADTILQKKYIGVSQYLLHEEWIMSLQTLLKMSTGSVNKSRQSQTPLSNGRRDDAMIKSCPFSHDVLFQVDHIVNLGAVDI